MNEYLKHVWGDRIKKTTENLIKNNMEVYYAETKSDVIPIVKNLIKNGDLIAAGGSMSLEECGIFDFLRSGDYYYLDKNNINGDEIKKIFIKSFSADAYFCSCNAITENGELYNVDGNSNRVAAICYGPTSVIMVVGYNKIVKNIDDAIIRVKSIAAPANCKRLECKSYCFSKGECVSISTKGDISSGSNGDSRICCNYVISAKQRIKGRIKIILVGEELGY